MRHAYIAVDFGGGSGRVIAGSIDRGQLTLTEIHRFPNRQIQMGGHTYWDFLALFGEMTTGLRKAVESGYRIVSIGIDTWGVDFGFIDDRGHLLSNPICYRDKDVDGAAEEFFSKHQSPEKHYSEAGIQIMDINSVFRLCRMKETAPAIINAAHRLLFIPDLFSFFLTGTACNEYTIASTSGLLDAQRRDWNRDLINECGLPQHIFGPIVQPGEIRGHLTDDVKRLIGADYDIPVVAIGSHDTASAVFAVAGTYETDRTAYLSSGTWSLLGVALDQPILTPQARAAGFTNEGGVDGKIRFLQNITGLWILQSLIAQWNALGLPTDYEHLISEAERATFSGTIDVDHPSFHSPSSMSEAIDSYCTAHGMTHPSTQGEYVRCVLQSLAMRYKKGIDGMNAILPHPIRRLQIIGGGSKNRLLNELTRRATGLEVAAGPVEATAIGNILVQARTNGDITSPADITEIN